MFGTLVPTRRTLVRGSPARRLPTFAAVGNSGLAEVVAGSGASRVDDCSRAYDDVVDDVCGQGDVLSALRVFAARAYDQRVLRRVRERIDLDLLRQPANPLLRRCEAVVAGALASRPAVRTWP